MIAGLLLLPCLAAGQPTPPDGPPAPVAQSATASAQGTRRHRELVQLQQRLARPGFSCSEVTNVLTCDREEEPAFCSSVAMRLRQRQCFTRSRATRPEPAQALGPRRDRRRKDRRSSEPPPGAPGSRAPSCEEMFGSFTALADEVQSRQRLETRLDVAPGAADLERELMWNAAATLSACPAGSREDVEIRRRLSTLIWPGAVVEVANVLLQRLKAGAFTLDELEDRLALVKTCSDATVDPEICGEIAGQLKARSDALALARAVELLRQHPELLSNSLGAPGDVEGKLLEFFQLLDAVLQRDKGRVPPPAPTMPYRLLVLSQDPPYYVGAPSTELSQRATPTWAYAPLAPSVAGFRSDRRCTVGDLRAAYVGFFRNRLGDHGLVVDDEMILEKEDEAAVQRRLPDLIASGTIPPLVLEGQEKDGCQKYGALCNAPYAGVFLLRFGRAAADGALQVSGGWWARDCGTVRSGEVPGASLPPPPPCDTVHAELSAHHAAGETYAKLPSGICGLSSEDVMRRQQKPSKPSPWLAAAFAGAPFLADPRATATAKVVPTVLDGALMAGAITSAALAVKYRNDYSSGRLGSVGPANGALTAGAAFLGGIVLTRLASGAVYAWTGWGRTSP